MRIVPDIFMPKNAIFSKKNDLFSPKNVFLGMFPYPLSCANVLSVPSAVLSLLFSSHPRSILESHRRGEVWSDE
jgi:hypothetical protein